MLRLNQHAEQRLKAGVLVVAFAAVPVILGLPRLALLQRSPALLATVECPLGTPLYRWRWVLGRELHCPRGHATAAYGVYECRCGALIEDWVFARCTVCGQTAGWTPCTTCGLPVHNPLL